MIKNKNNLYLEYDNNLKEEEEKLNIIYEKLLKNNQDKSAIIKFDRLIKSKIDYRGLLPISKSFEGDSLLTLSKFWMILILLKITKGRFQQDEFLTLINSSLTHELNDYEVYKEFYNEQCELIFPDEEAIKQINLNPKLKYKLDINISHDELKNNYIFLLFRPNYFHKINLDDFSKIKRKGHGINKNKRRKSENSFKNNGNK